MPKTKPLLLLILVLSCGPKYRTIPAPLPVTDTDYCGLMCSHLQTLGCEEGDPVYNNDLPGDAGVPNQSCSDWCVDLQNKGFFVNPKCVATINTCGQIEIYRQKEPETCNPDG